MNQNDEIQEGVSLQITPAGEGAQGSSGETRERESEGQGSGEGGSGENDPPKFRAWERATVPPKHIPYDRFHEVNTEKNQLRTELEQARARLAEIEARQNEVQKVKAPEEIKPEDFETPQEYMAARDQALLAKARSDWEAAQLEREQQRATAQHIESVGQAYSKNLAESIQRNPEIQKASEFFDAYAQQLHPQVAYELMIDENVGELMYDIATDQNLLQEIFRGNPVDAIRKIHKLSARIDRATRYAGQEARAQSQGVPQALTREQIAAGVPARVQPTHKAAPPNVYKDAGKMSMAEYMRARGK